MSSDSALRSAAVQFSDFLLTEEPRGAGLPYYFDKPLAKSEIRNVYNLKFKMNDSLLLRNLFHLESSGDSNSLLPIADFEPVFNAMKASGLALRDSGIIGEHRWKICRDTNVGLRGTGMEAERDDQRRHYCIFCKMGFQSDHELTQHRKCPRHRLNYCAGVYCQNRDALICIKDQLNMKVVEPRSPDVMTYDEADGLITFKVERGRASKLVLKIENCSEENANGHRSALVVRSVELLLSDPDVTMWDKHGFTRPEGERPGIVRNGIRVLNGQSFDFTLNVMKHSLGQYRLITLVNFLNESTKRSHILAREVLVQVTNADVARIKPTSPYVKVHKENKFTSGFKLVNGVLFKFKYSHENGDVLGSASKKLKVKFNEEYACLLHHNLRQFAGMSDQQVDKLEEIQNILESSLKGDHCEKLKYLLQAEAHQLKQESKNYDLAQVPMKQSRSGGLLELDVPGLAEKRPSVLKGDKVWVQLSGEANGRNRYEGFVHVVQATSIFVAFDDKLLKNFFPNMKFDVRFAVNEYPLKMMHHAIDVISIAPKTVGILFPDVASLPKTREPPEIRSYFNRSVENNNEQKMAVKHILEGGVPGMPYIVFGPPGTGKTVTLVEAIHQVWRHKMGSRILAAAPSNAASDVVAERILKNVPESQVLRYYAPSMDESNIPEKLKNISNFKATHSVATLEEVMKYRIVIVTLVTGGRLSLAELPKNHFTHIFVDEAGCATEPEVCIPLSGAVDAESVQLVLAGDPKQLGPVLHSRISIKHGLGVSLLERLMSSPNGPFQRDPNTKQYNPSVMTKLLKNFRSHESLVTLPSTFFYDGELIPSADELMTRSLERWEKLPTMGFPLVFHGVIGRDEREANSPSFFNREEVATVVDYIQNLLDSRIRVTANDIGVISPYKKQVDKIKTLMNMKHQKNKSVLKDWKGVTVASTEQFQGQERRVMVISTVRSEPDYLTADFKYNLGFLKNPKRFNVAITRAKALMIVVGNPKLLSLDPSWKELIKYAKANGAYRGVRFEPEPDVEQARDVEMLQMERKFNEMGLSRIDRGLEEPSLHRVSTEVSSPSDSFDRLDDLPEDVPQVRLEQ